MSAETLPVIPCLKHLKHNPLDVTEFAVNIWRNKYGRHGLSIRFIVHLAETVNRCKLTPRQIIALGSHIRKNNYCMYCHNTEIPVVMTVEMRKRYHGISDWTRSLFNDKVGKISSWGADFNRTSNNYTPEPVWNNDPGDNEINLIEEVLHNFPPPG